MEKLSKLFLKPMFRRLGTAMAVWTVAQIEYDAALEAKLFDGIIIAVGIAADLVLAYANRRSIQLELKP